MNKTSLINYFPENLNPRPQQEEVLKKIEKEIQKGTKYIVINAPTGFGKSAISKTIANYSKDPTSEYKQWINTYTAYSDTFNPFPNFGCMALTITKNLQDQYKKDFKDGEILKGKSNYQCNYDPDYDVEDAPCTTSNNLKQECWNCNRCSYYNQRNKTLSNKFQILNYSMFLNLPPHLRNRQFLILDEASEIEDEIVKNFSINIDYNKLDKVGIHIDKIDPNSSLLKIKSWLRDLHDITLDRLTEVTKKLKDKKSTAFHKNVLIFKFLLRFENKLNLISTNINESEYIIEENDDKKESITLCPLYVDKLSKIVFGSAEHVILMSATIIDHKHFCKTLGIKEKDYKYIEAKSTFDPLKSPIYCSTKYPLNYNLIDKNLPHVVDMVKMICDKHKKEKGIIHTNSFKISNALKTKLKSKRFLYREYNITNENLMDLHMESKEPTVLISPSMTHGVDLKGDLGRFQVIAKIPYLSLQSKRIKLLSKRDFRWYSNRMLSNLIQACGRCTRSDTDEVETYIVDGAIDKALKMNKSKIPKYFLERII